MDVSGTNRTRAPTAVVSPLAKLLSSGNAEKHEIERLQPTMADTAQKIIDGINNFLASMDVLLKFSIDKNKGEITVRVIRKDSDRIIREIPVSTISGGAGTIDEIV